MGVRIVMRLIHICWLLLASLVLSQNAHADIEGSQDHPLTGRYEGSEITGYSEREFDSYSIWNGEPDAIEGKIVEIAYQLPEGVTMVAARRNFAKRLEDQDFSIEFKCNSKKDRKKCSRDLAYGITRLPEPRMVVDSFNFTYSLYRSKNQGNTFVVLLASENNGRAYLQASIIEIEALEFKMVEAKEISDKLTTLGHIALYGIRFDTDSATLKPESLETLQELAKFLKANPNRKVMIVGHTDNQGSLDYNIDLSTRRANSVRSHLVNEHGIIGDLLKAAGVGFLAPVASNENADGRAQNRRVEIVAR